MSITITQVHCYFVLAFVVHGAGLTLHAHIFLSIFTLDIRFNGYRVHPRVEDGYSCVHQPWAHYVHFYESVVACSVPLGNNIHSSRFPFTDGVPFSRSLPSFQSINVSYDIYVGCIQCSFQVGNQSDKIR